MIGETAKDLVAAVGYAMNSASYNHFRSFTCKNGKHFTTRTHD
jgi:hypothetical protein